MLNAKDLIDDLQERAKENKRKAMNKAKKSNSKKNKDIRFSSAEPQRKINNQYNTPVHENKEIAKLAGVSETTVMRAKN